ncbi:hypothetical protein SteCoe_6991 [Stentor coeruleus]|uniref:Uncharacterized protein n=1 Tax=Stentor coeruleus TaxID=5963 RepID=A0A1R2CNJ4_9CILI|nr:hypothetical protein SteCoe_6991 [Stentor coeruleus]
MENLPSREELAEQNIFLRQERLKYYNLIAIATDEITILQGLSKNKKKKKPTEETKEMYEVLLKNHEDSLRFFMDCFEEESKIIIEKEGGNVMDYILALEKILKQKIGNCEFLINIVRALKLTYN